MDEQDPKEQAQPRVLLVTSPREQCGIREYSRELMKAATRNAVGVQIDEFPEAHPDKTLDLICCQNRARWDVVHLNHHAALHRDWKTEHIDALQQLGLGVIVTQHDTFEKAEIMAQRGLTDFRTANYLVVHEPVEGLRVGGLLRGHMRSVGAAAMPEIVMMRQPVPSHAKTFASPRHYPNHTLGLFGFDSGVPWKGFETAIRGAKEAGWDVLLLSADITRERAEELQALYPTGVEIIAGYQTTEEIVWNLSSCDATAFPYVTGGSGTSGAVRLGIAARRPVILSPPGACRQFRDLESDPYASNALCWGAPSPEVIASHLRALVVPDVWMERQQKVAKLADHDGWDVQVWIYVGMYRQLTERVRARRTR